MEQPPASRRLFATSERGAGAGPPQDVRPRRARAASRPRSGRSAARERGRPRGCAGRSPRATRRAPPAGRAPAPARAARAADRRSRDRAAILAGWRTDVHHGHQAASSRRVVLSVVRALDLRAWAWPRAEQGGGDHRRPPRPCRPAPGTQPGSRSASSPSTADSPLPVEWVRTRRSWSPQPAHRAADLAAGVDQPRRDPRVRPFDAGQAGDRHGHERERDADAADRNAGNISQK